MKFNVEFDGKMFLSFCYIKVICKNINLNLFKREDADFLFRNLIEGFFFSLSVNIILNSKLIFYMYRGYVIS